MSGLEKLLILVDTSRVEYVKPGLTDNAIGEAERACSDRIYNGLIRAIDALPIGNQTLRDWEKEELGVIVHKEGDGYVAEIIAPKSVELLLLLAKKENRKKLYQAGVSAEFDKKEFHIRGKDGTLGDPAQFISATLQAETIDKLIGGLASVLPEGCMIEPQNDQQRVLDTLTKKLDQTSAIFKGNT